MLLSVVEDFSDCINTCGAADAADGDKDDTVVVVVVVAVVLWVLRCPRKCVNDKKPQKHKTTPQASVTDQVTPKKILVATVQNMRRKQFKLECCNTDNDDKT
jgi:hypothetical protein